MYMVGPIPGRDEDTARIAGARGNFVSGLGGRVDALRVSLRAVEQSPDDSSLRHALLRRVHALNSTSRVLGFASVAEALTEVERRLRRSEFSEVSRSLDLLPSLALGTPASLGQNAESPLDGESSAWPLSVLIFGAQSVADAIQAISGTNAECERTEDLAHALEQARLYGPDLVIVDADCPGGRELMEGFAQDPLVEPIPFIVIGSFDSPEAASSYVAWGAARALSKPISADALQRTVVDLRPRAAEPRVSQEPLGDLSVEGLTDRIFSEMRRGLLESVEPGARAKSVGFGDGADVMAAVWSAVARLRELVTLRSGGSVRFDASGPEGALPIAVWSNEERRAGERGSAEPRKREDVTLRGRRIVVADDDPAVVWFMSGLLEALGVEVLEAHDGARALELTYETWPDLVVSDVLMPKLDGFALCHEIKRDVAVRDVPVILLSWKEDLLQRVRELGADADGYLRKEAAASTVAERLREVLRPRARVERRLAAGLDARGRLDGLTPRLILELCSAGERDVRVGIRDAAYLYEVQVRGGRLCSATRSSSGGSSERGELVLSALLGVSAGRFTVESDASPCRADFDGPPAQVLKSPIESARRSLNAVSAEALIGVTRVEISAPVIEGYFSCTPEPARGLLQKIMAGASPRELITSGLVASRLLEAVLSDVARRGAIRAVERVDSVALETEARASSLVPPSAPRIIESVPTAAKTVKNTDESVIASPPPEMRRDLPFSQDVTPPVDRVSDTVTEAVFNDGTLQGMGRPALAVSAAATAPVEPSYAPAALPQPPSAPAPVEEPDALAGALTSESPRAPAAIVATQVLSGSASPVSAVTAEQDREAPSQPLPAVTRPTGAGGAGWIIRALLAFLVSYAVVSYYRANGNSPAVIPRPRLLPASSR